ncbi:hypothetical protein ACHWQZ_G017623 [Mnemiopsis leidyi]
MADLADLVSRLEAVTVRLEKCAAGGGGKASAADDDDDFDTVEAITEFKAVMDKADEVLKASENLPSDVHEISKLLKVVCEKNKEFLRVSVRAKACLPADAPVVMKPMNDAITQIGEYRDKNRASKQFNHLSAVSEAIPAFGWVCVAPRPLDYMAEMIGASDFYINRILKDFKEIPGHKEWCQKIKQMFSTLKEYVSNNHKKGVTWNPNGGDAKEVAAKIYGGGAAPKAPAAPRAPPSAPAPPPPPPAGAKPKGAAAPPSANLFAEINKGADITKGLKKVTDAQKTHKNPELRGSSVVKEADLNKNKKVAAPAKKAAAPAKQPPKLQLVGKKWSCEYQSGVQDIVIEAQVSQSLYVYKCDNSVITVKGKINSITLDNCKKCGIIVDSLVASMDIVNSQSVKLQVNDKAPIVNIDKTDGCQVFVQRATGLDTEFVTAKSSEVNICLVEENGEYNESFVAEQFLTKFVDGKFVTELYEVVG